MKRRIITDLLDRMIPYSVWRTNPKPHKVARARTLVAVLAFSIIAPALALVVVIGLQLMFSDKDFYTAMGCLLAVILILVIQQMLFRASARLEITAQAFSIVFFLIVITAIVMTGGWSSPAILLLFCAPTIAYLISGPFAAVISGVITFLAGLAFLILDSTGTNLPDIMREDNRPYVQGLTWFIASAIQMLLFSTQAWLRPAIEED